MKTVVIGASAGGIKLLSAFLPQIPKEFNSPIIITQHIPEDMPDNYIERINRKANLNVVEAKHLDIIKAGNIYFAPAGYHLLVESKKYLALSVDERVNYSRPSIDVLFESAAEIFMENLLGIVLTGANEDGVLGAKAILDSGGTVIVQDPTSAEVAVMPQAVLSKLESARLLRFNTNKIMDYLMDKFNSE